MATTRTAALSVPALVLAARDRVLNVRRRGVPVVAVRDHRLDDGVFRARRIHDGRSDDRLVDVDRDAEHSIGAYPVAQGVRPAAAGDLADHLDEPRTFQPGDDLRGGGLGETGEFADAVAGQHTVGEQKRQGGALVPFPQPGRSSRYCLRRHAALSSCASNVSVKFPNRKRAADYFVFRPSPGSFSKRGISLHMEMESVEDSARLSLVVIRILVAAIILTALVSQLVFTWQIYARVPRYLIKYFSFFTVQSNLMASGSLLLGGLV